MAVTLVLLIVCSVSHLGVLDVVPSVAALDDGINPHVELCEVGEGLLDALGSSGISPEVGGLAEEGGTETLMGLVHDFILVGAAEGGSILHRELDVPDELAALGVA